MYYWSIDPTYPDVYHWCPNCPTGQQIPIQNIQSDERPPERFRECQHCRNLTERGNCE